MVGIWTLASRLLGLVRDVLMSGLFGTSLSMSAFVVAFMIPNLFRRLFGEGALSAAFVPVFVETREREGIGASRGLFCRALTWLALILAGFTAVGWLASTAGLSAVDPGGKTAAILALLRIMLPYMIFICMAALSMAALNACGHFAVPALTPVLLNVVWIGALVFVVPRAGDDPAGRIAVVAWAVLIAGVVQWAAQLPVLGRYGIRPAPAIARRDPELRRVLLLMAPAALGLAVGQVNVMIDKLLAAVISAQAPAALYFSERLVYLPLGLFATAMGLVLLPALSGHAARDAVAEIPPAVNHALRNLMFLMIPASVGLFVLARPVVSMLFEWGTFGGESTTLTVRALMFYAPGLLVFSVVKVLVPAFYARQNTQTPVRVAVGCVGLNLGLNLVFLLTWPAGWKHAGLACATVISSGLNGAVLAVLLHRQLGSPGWRGIAISAARCGVAALGMAWCAARVHAGLSAWALIGGLPGKLDDIAAVLGAVLAGAVSYGVLAWALRAPELREWTGALRREATN